METRICPECQQEHSKNHICPYCGEPVSKAKKAKVATIARRIFVFPVALFSACFVYVCERVLFRSNHSDATFIIRQFLRFVWTGEV